MLPGVWTRHTIAGLSWCDAGCTAGDLWASTCGAFDNWLVVPHWHLAAAGAMSDKWRSNEKPFCSASTDLCARAVQKASECPARLHPWQLLGLPAKQGVTCANLTNCRQCLRFTYQCRWCVKGESPACKHYHFFFRSFSFGGAFQALTACQTPFL